jgi:molybdate transport system permease protein
VSQSYVTYAVVALGIAAWFALAAHARQRPRAAWALLGLAVYAAATLSAEFVVSLLLDANAASLTSRFAKLLAALSPLAAGVAAAWGALRTLARNCDAEFLAVLWIVGYSYVFLLAAMLLADAFYTTPGHLLESLATREIQYAIRLSMLSCTLAAILSVWVAVPIGYVMSRFDFRGKGVVDAILDIPIVLPPLVVGLSLLVLFHSPLGVEFENRVFPVTYQVPSVVLAQFMVACAFAVRTMRATFEQIHPRQEQVALTLGCSRAQAFWRVVLPEARNGAITAATIAWARSLGEFGPILVFSGATRMRTEVLPTTVYLELTTGNIEAAVAVSLIMILLAVVVLFLVRWFGADPALRRVL